MNSANNIFFTGNCDARFEEKEDEDRSGINSTCMQKSVEKMSLYYTAHHD